MFSLTTQIDQHDTHRINTFIQSLSVIINTSKFCSVKEGEAKSVADTSGEIFDEVFLFYIEYIKRIWRRIYL